MKPIQIRAEQLELLELVSKAAFSNPFSEERVTADAALSGLAPGSSRTAHLNAALVRVRALLAELEPRPARLTTRERELLDTAHLFDMFHVSVEDFDNLIRRQLAVSSESMEVPFAGKVLDGMTVRGIPRDEAVRCFGMFFQLRRAYYFIDRALTGRSASMKRLRLNLWNNVFTHNSRLYYRHMLGRMEDFSTLLLGETGTGKGAAAGAIGRSGFIPFDDRKSRFTENFVSSFTPINLSQFTESLIESELFGHRKGAFTGAVEAHDGVFSKCSPHGSIFLDEIGEVPATIQIKLLNILQDRTFSPVGSHEKIRFNGRVIAATNRNLNLLRSERIFRDDFFYRLCSDVIQVPSLRERIAEDPGELDELVKATIERITGEPSAELTGMALEAIRMSPGKHYEWPGNVRELEQCVRRVLLTGHYRGEDARPAADLALAARIEAGSMTAAELLGEYCRKLYDRSGNYGDVARRTGLDRRTVKKYVSRQ